MRASLVYADIVARVTADGVRHLTPAQRAVWYRHNPATGPCALGSRRRWADEMAMAAQREAADAAEYVAALRASVLSGLAGADG